MKTNAGKCIIVCLCVVVSCSCFQNHIQALKAKVNELFGNKPIENDNTPPLWKLDHNGPAVSHCGDNDDTFYLFGINWRSIGSKVANNWWIIAISSILPFIVFWRIQYNMRNRLHEWKKLLIKKEKAFYNTQNNTSRRPTLPELTFAKHARRESMADASQKITNRPKKISLSNISQFGNIKKDTSERNDEVFGEVKRVHLIRRR